MNKVTIIGAGNVGATAAMNIARMGICNEVVLLDIKEGYAEGKAMDIAQVLAMSNISTVVTGVTNDYSATENSNVVVITSGVPRKPGMTREELVGINKGIVESCMKRLCRYNDTNTVYVIVSNPMDTMCMVAYNILNDTYSARNGYSGYVAADKVIGMGGILDSARFKYFIADALRRYTRHNVNVKDIFGFVIGGHGDSTMIPVVEEAYYKNKPITKILPDNVINEIVVNTMHGGATLTKLLGTSAWEAPANGIATTVDYILNDRNMEAPYSVYRPEYGIFIGSVTYLCRYGISEIEDWENISENVNKEFMNSVNAVKNVNSTL